MTTLDSQILPKFIKVNRVYINSYSDKNTVTEVIPIYIDIESIFYINPNQYKGVKHDSNEPFNYYVLRLKYNVISGMDPENELYIDSKSFELITRYLID